MAAGVNPAVPGAVALPRSRSRWRLVRVLAACVAVAALLLAGVSYLIGEPLRAHLERSLNAALQGYTVRLAAVVFQPFGFSLTLTDLTIAQNAHPLPPVARFPHLNASVQWRELLHGALVADFLLREPHVRIDHTQAEEEASDAVAMEDEGWQRALQAIYPLKINQFRIENGDVTYVDDPKRPLHFSRLNLLADNIRNIRSADRVYPSQVHLDGVIFDSGKLRLDGHANFLAEPTAAIDADIELDKVQLDYFKPILERINLWIADGALWARGHVEVAPQVQKFHVQNLTLRGVQLDYVHSAQTAVAEKARAEAVGQAAEDLSRATVAEFRVDELRIADSTVGYVDDSTDPGYRVFLERGDLTIKNVSNQSGDGPASVLLTGQFMGSGDGKLEATVEPSTPSPDLDLRVAIEGTQLRALNNLLLTIGNFDVVTGQLTFYSQIGIKNGEISGYLKPIFTDVEVYSHRQDGGEPLLHRIYEGLVGGTQTLLRNRSGEVATKVEITGRASDPETSTWALALGLIRNAFIKAIVHEFEPGPVASSDTE